MRAVFGSRYLDLLRTCCCTPCCYVQAWSTMTWCCCEPRGVAGGAGRLGRMGPGRLAGRSESWRGSGAV